MDEQNQGTFLFSKNGRADYFTLPLPTASCTPENGAKEIFLETLN